MERLKLNLLICLACLISAETSWAKQDCNQLNEIAKKDGPLYLSKKPTYQVIGNKGFRTYFYSAPSNACKIKSLFLIPKDNVYAYQEFKNGNETWIYVMYQDKNDTYPSGWMKKSDFRINGYFATNLSSE